MDKLQRQQSVNLRRVIAVAFEMAPHYFFNLLSIQIGARKRLRIEQHFPHVVRELLAIPNTKVVEFLSPKKETLEMKR